MDSKQLLQIVDKISTSPDSKATQKSIDYLDGKQVKHLIDLLNDPNKGRKNWQSRGFMPSYRNLTKTIIEKSGLVFVHGMPSLELWVNESKDEDLTNLLADYLHEADFNEFMINLDDAVRLLKTVAILVEYDSTADTFDFNMLHRGNSAVIRLPGSKEISTLVYCVEQMGDGEYHYRVITPTLYQDWVIKYATGYTKENAVAELVSEMENPYGFIPLTFYHDTNVPRSGLWNPLQNDLVLFNESLNMWMTDVLFSSSWSLRPSLYTNTVLGGSRIVENEYAPSTTTTHKLGLDRDVTNAVISGPDQVVVVDSQGVDSPFLEYKGPQFQLQQLQDLWNSFATNIAMDWSVNLDLSGHGQANSGFQLIVQEIPNLQLRERRIRMASAGLRRVCNTMASMLVTAAGKPLPEFETYVEFAEVNLPVDPKAETELWVLKIEKGLASREMYFEQVLHMSPEESLETVMLIDMSNQQSKAASQVPATIDLTVEENLNQN